MPPLLALLVQELSTHGGGYAAPTTLQLGGAPVTDAAALRGRDVCLRSASRRLTPHADSETVTKRLVGLCATTPPRAVRRPCGPTAAGWESEGSRMPMERDLDGRSALVSGGARGFAICGPLGDRGLAADITVDGALS